MLRKISISSSEEKETPENHRECNKAEDEKPCEKISTHSQESKEDSTLIERFNKK